MLKSIKFDLLGVGVNQDIGGFDVFVDDPVMVESIENSSNLDSDPQIGDPDAIVLSPSF